MMSDAEDTTMEEYAQEIAIARVCDPRVTPSC